MSQRLNFLGLKGAGIIAVLFIIGIILVILKINPSLGNIAIYSAVFIAIVFGLLGIIGILKRYM